MNLSNLQRLEQIGKLKSEPGDQQEFDHKTLVNRLDNQVLVRLYEKGFRRYNQ